MTPEFLQCASHASFSGKDTRIPRRVSRETLEFCAKKLFFLLEPKVLIGHVSYR